MRLLVLAAAAALIVPATALGWAWPVTGPVLTAFSFDAAHPYAAGQHRGIDIGAPAGAPVVAPASGTVSFAGTVPGGGKTVTIRTPDGYSVTLVHLGSFGVRRGAAVGEGDPIGTVGPSGVPELDVTYVYLGIRETADEQGYLDPLRFLPAPPSGSAEPPADPGSGIASPPAPVPVSAPSAASIEPQATAEKAAVRVPPTPLQPPPRVRVSAGATAAVSRSPVEPRHVHAENRARSVRRTRRAPKARARRVSMEPRVVHVRAPAPAVERALRPDAFPAAAGKVAPRAAAHGGLPFADLGATLGLALLLGGAGTVRSRLRRRRARGAPKAVRIIDADALLPDHTDLLRERDPAHRARVHDDCRRRAGAPPPPARRGDVLPHRHGRARLEGLPRGRGAGHRREDVRRSHRRRGLARAAEAGQR